MTVASTVDDSKVTVRFVELSTAARALVSAAVSASDEAAFVARLAPDASTTLTTKRTACPFACPWSRRRRSPSSPLPCNRRCHSSSATAPTSSRRRRSPSAATATVQLAVAYGAQTAVSTALRYSVSFAPATAAPRSTLIVVRLTMTICALEPFASPIELMSVAVRSSVVRLADRASADMATLNVT
jgi:hypothetical protein